MATSPAEAESSRDDDGEPWLPDDLVVDEVLTRLPAVSAARSRAVCRAWNAALSSDQFRAAHAARAAARQPPVILFFPPAEGPSTSFYTCSLAPAATGCRKLITVGGLAAEYVVLSRMPCRGLTLVRNARSSDYFVFNLSTGDHAALPPPPQRARRVQIMTFTRYDPRFHPTMAPWAPFEFSSTGLCFDPATGEHKVVRLFADGAWELKCEVHTLGSRGWRPCAGDVPTGPWPGLTKYLSGLPPVAVGGSFYWLLWPHSNAGVRPLNPLILSFSVADERFGWVHVPARVSTWRRNHRIRHLAELDGSLCAVAYGLPRRFALGGEERVIELLTWTPSPTLPWRWKTRCRIALATLPQPVRDELHEELHIIVPLCTTAGGKVVLLATGHHRVFAYDATRNAVEKVFSMEDYVNFPVCHSEARLHINVCLHEECLAAVPRAAPDDAAKIRLQVKLGGDGSAAVVGRREKHRRLCEKCAALGQGYGCVHDGWEQTEWTAALRDHLPPRQYFC